MYEALLKNTPEYQKTAASLASPGPAALFGLPPAGRALLYAALQKDTGRILCVVTPGEAAAVQYSSYALMMLVRLDPLDADTLDSLLSLIHI